MSAWRSLATSCGMSRSRSRPRYRLGPSRAVPGKATAVSIISYSVTGIGMLLAPDMER